jgi:hypothetical protein
MAGLLALAAILFAQFLAVWSRSKWSRHLTKSPVHALLATAGSNAASKISSACLDGEVGRFLHRLDGEIARRVNHNATLPAAPGDHGRPVLVIVAPTGLALPAATPWPTPQRFLPAVFRVSLLPTGVIEFVRFNR